MEINNEQHSIVTLQLSLIGLRQSSLLGQQSKLCANHDVPVMFRRKSAW